MNFKLIIAAISISMLVACSQDPANIVRKSPAIKYSSASQINNPFKILTKEGDTIYKIAKEHNVPTRKLIEINRLYPPYKLRTSQVLRLPQATFHEVKDGDTIYAISRSYGVDINRLASVNNISRSQRLTSGKKIIIPSSSFEGSSDYASSNLEETSTDIRTVVASDLGLLNKSGNNGFVLPKKKSDVPSPSLRASTLPSPSLKPGSKYAKAQYEPASYNYNSFRTSGSSSFSWPVKGKIISAFGPKKGGLYNDGINISAALGADITAAKAGKVVYSGNELRGYGNLVLIKHDDGYLTAYAHASEINVQKGDSVAKGQVIGKVGKSGHVSQPQLHFSIRKGRKAIDPSKYL